MSKYLLGDNRSELERLGSQHEVWKAVTEAFFDRLKVGAGWTCLDAGAGPGFVTRDLRTRVGPEGAVDALEPSPSFATACQDMIKKNGWTNVSLLRSTIEEARLTPSRYDLIFVRWVLSFSKDLNAALHALVPALRPGGFLAVQDYYYEGLSFFPRGGAWDGMADVARTYYASAGGDLYVAARVPMVAKKFGLRLISFSPTVLAGGHDSPVMDWGYQYFRLHIPIMADKGLVSMARAEALLADLETHRTNPDAIYFSPMIVDVALQRPA